MMANRLSRVASHGLTLVLTTALGCSGTYTVGDSHAEGAGGAANTGVGNEAGGAMRLPIRAESPLLTSSHAPVQGCLNCVWKLTDRGYELDVPPSTRTYPEAYFVWNFLVPEDLSKTQAAFTIKNPNSKSVFVRALAVSADGRPLPWADGGEVKVRAGETRDVSLTPARPAYEVTGFDAARINRIGVSLRVPADTDGVATVIIRGMRVGSAD